MIWLYEKLKYFCQEDRVFLTTTVTSQAYDALTLEQQNMLKILFSMVKSTTTESMMKTLVLFLRDLFLLETGPFVFTVNKGENFSIRLTAEGDWSGYKLVAREHFTNDLLTLGSLDGTNHAHQTIEFLDFPLAASSLHLVRVQLEQATAGTANGEAVALLAKMYFVCDFDLDAP